MELDTADRGRGVVEVAGTDARELLQRLITNDVEGLVPGQARYAALLTPQGKIVADFIIVSAPNPDQADRFLLDCSASLAADLAKKLTMYKLRAKVSVADRSGELEAIPLAEQIAPTDSRILVYADPRAEGLGFRAIGSPDALEGLRD